MATETPLPGRVRKLLAEAEDPACTPREAATLTAQAVELMARYGIDRARLAAASPDTDTLADKVIDIPGPWGPVHAYMLGELASAMRCQAIELDTTDPAQVHIFGFTSDLERVELLYTALVLQIANGLAATPAPAGAVSDRQWRRSWLIGFGSAVYGRVKAAEQRAAANASTQPAGEGPPTAVVLADRALIVQRLAEQAYPDAERARITFTDHGYRTGYAKGSTAGAGSTQINPDGTPALPAH